MTQSVSRVIIARELLAGIYTTQFLLSQFQTIYYQDKLGTLFRMMNVTSPIITF